MAAIAATPEEIERAARALRDGLLVAFPTETVYGLGADATNAEAIARVFAAKGRPARDRKSTRLNSSHIPLSRMPSSA